MICRGMKPHIFWIIVLLGTIKVKGNADQPVCRTTCENGCDLFTRACNNCTNNRYEQFCDGQCSPFCNNSCDRYTGNCDSCIEGRFASWCIESCSNGCLSGCGMETGSCFFCKTGLYGEWCNVRCPSGCYNGCNRITGDCLSCKKGYYGRHCNVVCVEASCQNGCDQFYGTCKVCQSGFYGDSCDIRCRDNCKQLMCDSFSGNCIDCTQGYHGLTCNQSCPEQCNGNCNFQNGSCFSCNDGYHGDRCTSKCPENCNGPCGANGTCFSCKSGFFGEKCQSLCSQHCQGSCDQQTGNCFVCKDGFWGGPCEQTCGENCLGPCHKNSSHCYACYPGWYGHSCENQCPTICQNLLCIATGGCSSCVSGFYGDKCEMNCTNCINETCRQSDGFCIYGCSNESNCKTLVSTSIRTSLITSVITVTSRIYTGTNTGNRTSSSFYSTKPNPTKETFSPPTLLPTEVSKPIESGDREVLIIVIIAVSIAMTSLCIGVVIYCVRKRRHSPEPKKEETRETGYTHMYDDVTQKYDEIGDTVRESMPYDDIENVIAVDKSPGNQYHHAADGLSSAGDTNQETALNTTFDLSGNSVDSTYAMVITASQGQENVENIDSLAISNNMNGQFPKSCPRTKCTDLSSSGSISNSSVGYTYVLSTNDNAVLCELNSLSKSKADILTDYSRQTDLRGGVSSRKITRNTSSESYAQVLPAKATVLSDQLPESKTNNLINYSMQSDLRAGVSPRAINVSSFESRNTSSGSYAQVLPASDTAHSEILNLSLESKPVNSERALEMIKLSAEALNKTMHTGLLPSDSSSTLSRDYVHVFPSKSSDSCNLSDWTIASQIEDAGNESTSKCDEEKLQDRRDKVGEGRESKCSDYASIS